MWVWEQSPALCPVLFGERLLCTRLSPRTFLGERPIFLRNRPARTTRRLLQRGTIYFQGSCFPQMLLFGGVWEADSGPKRGADRRDRRRPRGLADPLAVLCALHCFTSAGGLAGSRAAHLGRSLCGGRSQGGSLCLLSVAKQAPGVLVGRQKGRELRAWLDLQFPVLGARELSPLG